MVIRHLCVVRSVGRITIDYLCHHLVESVGNAVAISLTNILGFKVRCKDREQLSIVSHSQEFFDGTHDIAIVLHLGWFSSYVINAQYVSSRQFAKLGVVCSAKLCNMHGIDNGENIVVVRAMSSVRRQVRFENIQSSDKVLQRLEHGCLAVSTSATQDDTELCGGCRQTFCDLLDLVFNETIADEPTIAELHFIDICRQKILVCLLLRHRQPKTPRHSPPLAQELDKPCDFLFVCYFHIRLHFYCQKSHTFPL